MASLDLLLHPVRLRILQEFFGRASLTTGEVATLLPQVPPASLYRHVARLVAAGVLVVVEERQIRGAVERVYELRQDAARAADVDLAAMTVDEHREAFLAFVAGVVASFDRYLTVVGDAVDPRRDGVSYSMSAAWLDDAEFGQLLTDLATLLAPIYQNGAREGRTRRLLASALMPQVSSTTQDGGVSR